MANRLEQFRRQERAIARSVLDRLLDETPDLQRDPPLSLSEQVRQMREAIRRDLEALLNTRRNPETPPAALQELRDGLVSYGIDGVVAANLVTDESKLRLARAIERRIALFETRLNNVRVTILKSGPAANRALRMRINATFRLNEAMPAISFESTIDPSTQRFLLEAANG
jgi:type VI secretion system protein ImpF